MFHTTGLGRTEYNICDPPWENVPYRNSVQMAKQTPFEGRSNGFYKAFERLANGVRTLLKARRLNGLVEIINA